jgi:hypothetical protein
MARLRCDVLRRDGPGALPCVVRDEAGRVLHLFGEAPPRGARWLGTLDGSAVWGMPVADALDGGDACAGTGDSEDTGGTGDSEDTGGTGDTGDTGDTEDSRGATPSDPTRPTPRPAEPGTAHTGSPTHGSPTPLEVLWLEGPGTDEVDLAVGPDRDGWGIFDPPGAEGTVTGDSTAEGTAEQTGDRTGDSRSDGEPGRPRGRGGGGEQRRTAVLAWIVANEAGAGPGAPSARVVPCEPLKRLIADEPLDPLPALDGVPPPRARPPGAAGRPDLAPEREDTATQIQGFAPLAGDAPGDATDGRPRSAGDTDPDADPDADPEGTAAPPAGADRGGPSAPARGGVTPRGLLLAALAAAIIAWLLHSAT